MFAHEIQSTQMKWMMMTSANVQTPFEISIIFTPQSED
jgi:hypothetical protein